jgi:DNA-binding IclR family transcriptional regulator
VRDNAGAHHGEVSRAHLALLYPPGPDGATARELADRLRSDPATVQRLLDDLQELGYVDLQERAPNAGRRAWLTAQGYDLVHVTEDALVQSLSSRRREPSAR